MLFVNCSRCAICHRARRWLDGNDYHYLERDIVANNPTVGELHLWHSMSGLPLLSFFNTRSAKYAALGLEQKLPRMTENEQFTLLASDGMLLARPIVVLSSRVLVGFQPENWKKLL